MKKIKDKYASLSPTAAWRKRYPERAKKLRKEREENKRQYLKELRMRPCRVLS